MKNPLNKRLLRELRSDLGKYIVIFLLMILSISEVSGFLVADNSMITAYRESFEKYNIEDGHFSTTAPLKEEQKTAVEENGVHLYKNYYLDRPLENGSTLRIFAVREQVNLACVMEGSLPEKTGEIAIDRMYADNNGFKVGDTLNAQNPDGDLPDSWLITGLVALSDYSTMFENNNDSMFDSLQFGVAVVSKEEFSDYPLKRKTTSYAWKYETAPKDEEEEKVLSDQFLEKLAGIVPLSDYVPRYLNQAIQFTGEDMGSDKATITVFLYIIIVILAFVFAVTISNTITREAAVIGTLRASGYTRSELIRHYMAMPLIVTLISALIGNILGYTVLKNWNADLYYGSYSLPTYRTLWNAEAFWETTLVPLIIMLAVTYLILWRKLRLSPLKFIRRDLSTGRQKKAVSLSPSIPIFGRFRLRVIFQNLSNYILLFIGIVFANLLLLFGLLFPSLLGHFQDTVTDNMLSEYQYILQLPAENYSGDRVKMIAGVLDYKLNVKTENPDAEAFSAYSLKTEEGSVYPSEEVIIYGITPDSRYLSLALGPDDVYISTAYADKYGLKTGDTITLRKAYEKQTFDFTITGVYDYQSALAVFMDQEAVNETFGLGKGFYSGYFSDTPITDIDEQYIGTVIDADTLTKISRQLDVSMGGIMKLIDVFSVLMFMILIYLLSKIIIEKNAQSISMTKILGYSNREISRLYLLPTSILVILFLLITLPIGTVLLMWLYRNLMLPKMNGYLPIYLDPKNYVTVVLLGIATYLVVAALEYRKIRKVPMDEALKNAE